jgi:acyl-CoA synthetase (NDP forming)
MVDGVDELVDVAIAVRGGIGRGGRSLGILTTSGGAGSLAADAAESCGLTVPALAPETQAALVRHVPGYGAVGNPVDVTAQLMTANVDDFAAVCEAVASDPTVDSVLVVLTNVTGANSERVAGALTSVTAGAPLSVAYLAAPDATATARATLAAGAVPVFDTVAAAVRTIDRLTRPARAAPAAGPAATDSSGPPAPPRAAAATRASGAPELSAGDVLTEWSGGPLLDAFGITRPAGELVADRAAAEAAAARFAAPVVLKVISADLLHKTDHGGVRVGVEPAAVGAAFDEMVGRVAAELPDAVIDGVLVQCRAAPGVELLVGVTGPADGYPPVVTVGVGGTAVEVYADVASALAPLDEAAALDLLRRLRGFPLLTGYRSAPPADVEAAAAAVAGLSQAAVALGPGLVEIEVNPLIVHRPGSGATAVDLLLRRRAAGHLGSI